MRRRKTSFSLAAVAVALAGYLASPVDALDPSHPLGVDPERAYQGFAEGIDSVDLFSGTLSLTIPIGPFTLTNNSNIWHYRTEAGTGKTVARPDWENTGGIGWRLGWGELYNPAHSYNESGEWLYIDENGGRHALYRTLHRDDGDDGDDDDNLVFYSRDGSYLRMRLTDDNPGHCHAYIESPDGTTRKLTGSCGPGTTFTIRKVWSPFASEADPDLTIAYGVDPDHPVDPKTNEIPEDTLRTVTNRYGLVHKVHLTNMMNGDPTDPIHNLLRIITKVDLEGFDGQRSVYTFAYRQIHVDRSCKDDAGSTSSSLEIPHLERIDLPDGTSYSMVEDGDLLYEDECRVIGGHLVDDLPGVLTGINLPTGGQIRWTHQRYEFPPGDSSSPFNTGAGIKSRSLHTAGTTATAANQIGIWKYKSTTIPRVPTGVPGEFVHPEKHTEVVYPTGDCSKHFFDAIYWVDPENSSDDSWGWERGLPFVFTEESGGKYLSSQIYTGNDGKGSCDPDTKLRSTYLRFRHDTTPGTDTEPLANWINTNRQVEARRTVFHDDGDWWVDAEYSDFDGLGNFRQVVETSNFWGTEEQSRQATIGFNRSSGTYPETYTALQVTEPWILRVFDSTEISDSDATGSQLARTEYSFEDATGFLSCTRSLTSGTAWAANDLLTVQLRDSLGRVTDVKRYGGDAQVLAPGGSGCGTVPAQPAYWTHNEYDALSGVLVRTRPKTPTGADGPFLVLDLDVEPRTGFVLRSRDTAGFETAYTYDEAGRLLSATPAEGAATVYSYYNPTATDPARIVAKAQTPGSPPTVLNESEVALDDFGRMRMARRKLPGGVWSEQEMLYNARGWMESSSEWGDLAKKTLFSEFDPFGRPTVITPPDGAAHNVLVSYRGERIVNETRSIALAGGEAPVTKTSIYDGFGRLRRVWEYSRNAHDAREHDVLLRCGRAVDVGGGGRPDPVLGL